MQWAREVMTSLRNTRPGHITRIGGCCFSMVRTCSVEVWVRRAMSGFWSTKKVSCMSRAGCSSGKLSAVKMCQSSSMSGPVTVVKPMRSKMLQTSSIIREMGWREPSSAVAAVRVTSMSFCWVGALASRRARCSSKMACARCFSKLTCCPKFLRSSTGTFLISLSSPCNSLFLLKNCIRNFSNASAVLTLKFSNSELILSMIDMNERFCEVSCILTYSSFSTIVVEMILMSLKGRSKRSFFCAAILSTTSIPSTTSPKTVYCMSRNGAPPTVV